jgi:hypothetical protein
MVGPMRCFVAIVSKCVSCHCSLILETGGELGDFPASSLDIQIAKFSTL